MIILYRIAFIPMKGADKPESVTLPNTFALYLKAISTG
jgi:hypothetical protein